MTEHAVLNGGDKIESVNSSIQCKSSCGPGTKLVDNTCVIDFGDPHVNIINESAIVNQNNPKHSVHKYVNIDFERALENDPNYKIPHQVKFQATFKSTLG